MIQTAHILLLTVASFPVDSHSFDNVSRNYRIETYDTFREQRPEFDRRQRLGVEATRRWKEAKFDTQLQERIVEWFVESTDAIQKGDQLPELPGEPSRAFQKEAAAQEARANAALSPLATESTESVAPATRQTSIVTNARSLEYNDGRETSDTVRVLGGVGRAVTNALMNHQPLGEITSSVDLPDDRNIESSSNSEGETKQ